MGEIATHLATSRALWGTPRILRDGVAEVEWLAPAEAAVDEAGLVHGGHTFGIADYAAMVAVNDPLVLLVGAQVEFVAPVAVGEVVVARAEVVSAEGRRHRVHVLVSVGDREVLRGHFDCVVAKRHPLAAKESA